MAPYVLIRFSDQSFHLSIVYRRFCAIKYLLSRRLWLSYLRLNSEESFLTNSTLVSPVKMEYGWNFSISGLKMMMKSGLGKIFLKFLHALTMSFLLLNFDQKYKFSNKNNMVSAWRNFKNIFLDHFSSSFLGQKC